MTKIDMASNLIELGHQISVAALEGRPVEPLAETYRREYRALKQKHATGRNRLPLPDPNHPRLTAREREVVALATQGGTDGSISRALGICVGTVKVHLQNARLKTTATVGLT